MRTDGNKSQVNNLLLNNKIITNGKEAYIKYHITTTAGRIAECLQRHNLLKERIKKINPLQKGLPYIVVYLFHEQGRENKPLLQWAER